MVVVRFEGRRNKQSAERNSGESHQWELASNRRHNPFVSGGFKEYAALRNERSQLQEKACILCSKKWVATWNQQYAVLRNEKSQLEERNMQCAN